ncbi:hypothetical protein G6O69_16300 [Pseudenhygromyxa sp. WMMC2535]|uniref:hypothetical protein n=1 Tax=Pseudenhygromyxa sp. WMMC2535 TaxID=2712867 RepID=UPI001552F214|nr:hypothetical protein [Pseudenhygromyxa sp. WMMC2535]NVB39405.1 hypothetical protein [Pseudenhygromyxa sp. WMMC2535]
MTFRTAFAAASLGLCAAALSLLACNTSPEAQLETYGDEAVEDYGCIEGDLECACAPGDFCDLNLTCVDGICQCLEDSCEPVGPATSEGDDEDSSGDSGTDTDSESDESGSETADSGETESTESTTDEGTSTDTDTTETDTDTDTTETDTDTDTTTG